MAYSLGDRECLRKVLRGDEESAATTWKIDTESLAARRMRFRKEESKRCEYAQPKRAFASIVVVDAKSRKVCNECSYTTTMTNAAQIAPTPPDGRFNETVPCFTESSNEALLNRWTLYQHFPGPGNTVLRQNTTLLGPRDIQHA